MAQLGCMRQRCMIMIGMRWIIIIIMMMVMTQ